MPLTSGASKYPPLKCYSALQPCIKKDINLSVDCKASSATYLKGNKHELLLLLFTCSAGPIQGCSKNEKCDASHHFGKVQRVRRWFSLSFSDGRMLCSAEMAKRESDYLHRCNSIYRAATHLPFSFVITLWRAKPLSLGASL